MDKRILQFNISYELFNVFSFISRLRLLAVILFFAIGIGNSAGQDYIIEFEGIEASTQIDSIFVENTTQGKSIGLKGDENLHLVSAITGNSFTVLYDAQLKVYPNPFSGQCTIEIDVPQSGRTAVEIFNLAGVRILRNDNILPVGKHSFNISGLNAGLYLAQVNLPNGVLSAKLISTSNEIASYNIKYQGKIADLEVRTQLKSVNSTRSWQYNQGDLLQFTGVSGNFRTIVMDIPQSSKIIKFRFVESVDIDGNHYPIVQIGSQVWMAENLKVSKYNDGTPIHNITDGNVWANLSEGAYCFYNNEINNKDIYGALYNWHALNSGKLAPSGWRVATENDWNRLMEFLIANGYNHDGTMVGNKIGKSLASIHLWWPSSYDAGVGNTTYPAYRNLSGFNGLPAGTRTEDGGFGLMGGMGFWWSFNEQPITRRLDYNHGELILGGHTKIHGFSVRCLLSEIFPPEVVVLETSNLTSNSIEVCAQILNDGNDEVTERGIVFGTAQNPTTSDSKMAIESDIGSFCGVITGLSSNTTYYVRAYAINESGVAYSDQVTFITLSDEVLPTVSTSSATQITINSAVLGGDVINDGNGTVTERGIVYDTSQNPTTSNTKVSMGAGKGSFSNSVSGLSPGTTYYVRAYAINGAGIAYGTQVTFNTISDEQLASVSTAAATQITINSAVLGGNVSNDGNGVVTERGIVYDTSQNPTTSDSKVPMGAGKGSFNNTVSGLSPGTTYYVRAYAINGAGIAYGTQVTFNTISDEQLASVSTAAATQITINSAVLGGNVSNDGNGVVTERGIVYDTSQNPTTSDTKVPMGVGKGSFSNTVSGLSPGTTYYVRAYAINGAGIAYGTQVTFNTISDEQLASISTTAATQVTINSAVLGGNVTDDGNGNVTERGIVYSTSQNPTTANTKVAMGSGLGSFSNTVTGLSPGTTYYAKAYAINGFGTAYGAQVTFTTLVDLQLATVTTTAAAQVTINSAVLGGNVTEDGNGNVTERGIVYSTSQNPTTANTKVAMGSGLGIFSETISGLSSNTTYYARAYAVNGSGTAYGAQVTFTTLGDVQLATVSTAAATQVTINSAVLGGNVTDDGNGNVTERGIVYSTSQNPTTSNSKVPMGSGLGIFSETISGLSSNTTYYARAYAINGSGTAYGLQVSFTTIDEMQLAIVSTLSASQITINSAILGGNVIDDGQSAVTERGILYNTSQNPTISDNKVPMGSGEGPFSNTVTGLSPGTTYYVRAYAVNGSGISYGNQISILTGGLPGSVVGSLVDTRDGNVYQTIQIGDQIWMAENLAYLPTVSPSNQGSYTIPYYYVYDYQGENTDQAKQQANYSKFGVLYNHIAALNVCPAGWRLPNEIDWNTLTNFLGGVNIAGGKMKSVDGWNTPNTGATNSSGFTGLPGGYRYSKGIFDYNGKYGGWWSSNNLDNYEAWYWTLNYDNSKLQKFNLETIYGMSVRCIKVEDQQDILPTVSTLSATDITYNSAVLSGDVSNSGTSPVLERGIVYSTSQNPTISDTKVPMGSGLGPFSNSVTGLSPETTYYVRAYAVNTSGTSYGTQVIFTTLYEVKLATVSTTTATQITINSAVLGGVVIDDGIGNVTERGIVYSTSENPTTSNTKVSMGAGLGSFSNTVTGLSPGITYFARAYAVNTSGTAYGNQITFTTLAEVPTVFTNTATQITLNSAVLGGIVTDDGIGNVTERGIVYSTSENPTTSNTKVSMGAGLGSFSNTVTGLSAGTTYYVRAYAINGLGIAYGNQISISIGGSIGSIVGTLIDARDGNIYQTIQIGDQIWMAENLAYLPAVRQSNNRSETEPRYYVYGYEGSDVIIAKQHANYETYGVLYNWPAAIDGLENAGNNNVQGVCPSGWHLPNDSEWRQLEAEALGIGDAVLSGWRGTNQGSQLKSISGWASNGNGTNTSGFSALPGGINAFSLNGFFTNVGFSGFWWSSSEFDDVRAFIRNLSYDHTDVYRGYSYKINGLSVRCVKD